LEGTPPNPIGRRTYAVAATQTITPPNKKPQPRRIDSKELNELDVPCFSKTLTFKELPSIEQSSDRRYPQRTTRDLGRLKYWQGERIDYAHSGYWVQKPR
jgi:hypothetical protein